MSPMAATALPVMPRTSPPLLADRDPPSVYTRVGPAMAATVLPSEISEDVASMRYSPRGTSATHGARHWNQGTFSRRPAKTLYSVPGVSDSSRSGHRSEGGVGAAG